jgi:hypothetical protein
MIVNSSFYMFIPKRMPSEKDDFLSSEKNVACDDAGGWDR